MLNQIFKALSDPTRRAMVERLGRGNKSVSELAEPLSMSLAAVVQHLQVLEAAGLAKSTKAGRVRTYRLNTKQLAAAEEWLTHRRTQLEQNLDNLEKYLEKTK